VADASKGEAFGHDLLQHFNFVLSDHFLASWFGVFLCSDFWLLVSAIDYLGINFFSVTDEVVGC
jgi:hypothetical protein